MSSKADIQDTEAHRKWGISLRQGYVLVPWVLMRRQAELEIDAVALVVLLQLIASWWEADDAPYPSTATIAKRMGVSTRTVQRALKELEERKLLKRQPLSVANNGESLVTRYDLRPLADRLEAIVVGQVQVANEVKRVRNQLRAAA